MLTPANANPLGNRSVLAAVSGRVTILQKPSGDGVSSATYFLRQA
jgi:hypothetical protein